MHKFPGIPAGNFMKANFPELPFWNSRWPCAPFNRNMFKYRPKKHAKCSNQQTRITRLETTYN